MLNTGFLSGRNWVEIYFLDGGHVWPSVSEIKINKAVLAGGWGLRYYLQNFVVRFDMGFSSEGTGIYFNFGHLF